MTIDRDGRGRWVVRGRRVYGCYRSRAAAEYRLAQVERSSRPRRQGGAA